MANNLQPTILVKKADGTKVRVSLDEYKKMRGGGNEEDVLKKEESGMENDVREMTNDNTQIPNNIQMTNDKPVEQVVEKPSPVTLVPEVKKEIKKDDLMVETSHELANFTPVTDIFHDQAAANFEWGEKDHKSLLEEDIAEVEKLKSTGSVHVGGHDLQEHIKMPSVGIEDDLRNRAKSLVISWQKGIRNDNQLLDYAMRDAGHGGLGLDDEQASRFLQSVKGSRNNLDNLFAIVFEKKKQKVEPEVIIKKEVLQNNLTEEVPKINNNIPESGFSKPFYHTAPVDVAHDATPPENIDSKTVGPKQEMASFSLVDYRRLAKDPKMSANMLLSKLNGWKTESFLMFLDAVDGWNQSPLNKMYTETTVEAINSHLTVAQVLQSKNSANFLTLPEYESVVEVDKSVIV